MSDLRIRTVDAGTDAVFGGNPADAAASIAAPA
jgi:hypothetical protein